MLPSKVMRLVTFSRAAARPEAVVLQGFQFLSFGMTMLAVSSLAYAPESPDPPYTLMCVTLMAPATRPTKIVCVRMNYRDHAAESRSEVPPVPTIFSKFPNVVIGPGDTIVLPKASRKPDYEGEFGFVIGKGGRNIPAERAF